MLSLTQKIFLSLLLILVFLNLFTFGKEVVLYEKVRAVAPHQFPGYKFLELQSILKNESVVGYYTDKGLSVFENSREFSQAQFVLAPLVLDADNMNHRYVILACSTPSAAIEAIKMLKAEPVKISPSGIILVERKP